eukprot:jgi/Bigna1/128499/aug1.6_g3207
MKIRREEAIGDEEADAASAAQLFKDRIPNHMDVVYKEIVLGGEKQMEDHSAHLLDWIETTISNGGKILICCDTGVFLAPSIVIMYLMYQQELNDVINMAMGAKEDPEEAEREQLARKARENPQSELFNSDELEEEEIRQRELQSYADRKARKAFGDDWC